MPKIGCFEIDDKGSQSRMKNELCKKRSGTIRNSIKKLKLVLLYLLFIVIIKHVTIVNNE